MSVFENDPIGGIVSRKHSVTSCTTPIIKRIAHTDACTETSVLTASLAAGGGSLPSRRSEETGNNMCVTAKSSRSTECASILAIWTSGLHIQSEICVFMCGRWVCCVPGHARGLCRPRTAAGSGREHSSTAAWQAALALG